MNRKQSAYEYACIRLHGGQYEDGVQDCLGSLFEVCSDCLGMPGDLMVRWFLESGLSNEIERQNPVFILGKSAYELVIWMADRMASGCSYGFEWSLPKELEGANDIQDLMDRLDCCDIGSSADFLLGSSLALLQIYHGYTYEQIFRKCDYDLMLQMTRANMDLVPSELLPFLLDLLGRFPYESRLKEIRKSRHVSQAQLAEDAGVSIRAIQQYEQGVRSINKASLETVYRISRVLQCNMEDLMDPLTTEG